MIENIVLQDQLLRIKYMIINILKQQPKQSNLMEISVPVPIYSSWLSLEQAIQ